MYIRDVPVVVVVGFYFPAFLLRIRREERSKHFALKEKKNEPPNTNRACASGRWWHAIIMARDTWYASRSPAGTERVPSSFAAAAADD